MLLLCMWLGLSPRILGIVMHSAKPALVICLLCIGAAARFLQFALTERVVVFGAGSSLFAASFARCRPLGSDWSRLRPRCAPLCPFLRDLRALSANSPPAHLTPSFGSRGCPFSLNLWRPSRPPRPLSSRTPSRRATCPKPRVRTRRERVKIAS